MKLKKNSITFGIYIRILTKNKLPTHLIFENISHLAKTFFFDVEIGDTQREKEDFENTQHVFNLILPVAFNMKKKTYFHILQFHWLRTTTDVRAHSTFEHIKDVPFYEQKKTSMMKFWNSSSTYNLLLLYM